MSYELACFKRKKIVVNESLGWDHVILFRGIIL